jgi:hypothetical protein
MGRPRKRKRTGQAEDDHPAEVDPAEVDPALQVSWVDPTPTSLNDDFLLFPGPHVDPWLDFPTADYSITTTTFDADPTHHQPAPEPTCLTTAHSTIASFPDMQPGTTTCDCLATMIIILQSLRPMTTFQFPSSVGHLRNAVTKLSPVIECSVCPKECGTGMQNIMLLHTVLSSLTGRFHHLLQSLDTEAQRVVRAGEIKQLRVADPSDMAPMHTGTPDCPMGINISVDGNQWRDIARGALRTLVHGPGSTMESLLENLRRRQELWHSDPAMTDMWRPYCKGLVGDGRQQGGCISNIIGVQKQIEQLNL